MTLQATRFGNHEFVWGSRTYIMGVLNITPDSLSDGGLFFEQTKAYDQAKLMINSAATIIDVGGESTRPGSNTVEMD